MRRLPFSALLASILFERALDGGSVLFFLLLAVLLGIPGSTAGGAAFAMMRTGALVAAAVFVLLVGAALLLLFRREVCRAPLRPARGPASRAPGSPAALGRRGLPGGLRLALERRASSRPWSGSSLLMWLVINAQIYAVMRAFHIVLPFSASFVVTAAAVLGLAVPTPGGIGSYQAAVQYALTRFYGVPLAPASGVAVLAWAVSFLPITLIGLAASGDAHGARERWTRGR